MTTPQPPATPPRSLRLLLGLLTPEPHLLDELTGRLALEFGALGLLSPRWVESAPGGEPLARQWLVVGEPLSPAGFPAVKRHALRVEELYHNTLGRPRIRLDAAYLDALRVARATVSDAPHRLYLGSGVFGEVILHWREGAGFAPMPWTRPEDCTPAVLEFLDRVHADWMRATQPLPGGQA